MRRLFLMAIAIAASSAVGSTAAAQTDKPPAPAAPRATNKFVIRGCLSGSNLIDMEPSNPPVTLPEKLKVSSTRVIRDQVKALSGHQVEVTGALFGVAGVEQGILIGDSDAAKVYIGGGDPNLGEDLVVRRNDPPSIRATMIKDVAAACAAKTPERK